MGERTTEVGVLRVMSYHGYLLSSWLFTVMLMNPVLYGWGTEGTFLKHLQEPKGGLVP